MNIFELFKRVFLYKLISKMEVYHPLFLTLEAGTKLETPLQ
jgi:hypothetical protein